MTTKAAIAVAIAAVVSFAWARPSVADDRTRTFAGSVQLDYLAVPTDSHSRDFSLDGATVELSLKLTEDLSKDVTASVKVCYACHGFEAGTAMIELRAADELRLRVGRMTPAFGSFPLRHDPANHLTSDKPLPYDMGRMLRRLEWNEGILPAPWVDNGLEVAGTHFWDGGQLDYSVYAVSGPKGSSDAADFDFTLSRSPSDYYVDNNSEPTVGARIAAKLELDDDVSFTGGASGMAGHYDPARQLGFWIAGLDGVLQLGSAFIRAEYLVRATQMALGADPATRFKYGAGTDGKFSDYFVKDGFYAEGELPLGGLSVIARWDGLRRIGNVLATSPLSSSTYVLRYTGGLAYKLRSGIRVKSSVELYQFGDFPDELAVHLGIASAF